MCWWGRQVLADDLGIATENTAKWWTTHQHTGATFQAGQLIIIDEASLAGTLSLDRITQAAEEAGAKLLLVDVHRFTHAWEQTASLELRHGRTPVIDTYLDHERIHDGDAEAMTDAAYSAWRHDRQQGLVSVLIAETRENVTALNVRARADLILDGALKPGPEITLSDGSAAGVGDAIITRRNDRRLRNRHGWIRNGQTWTITAEQDRWGSIAQLAAEYDTIAAAAQHDRWTTLITTSGLTTDQAQAVIDSNAFGALTAELRRAEANHHNVDTFLPRLTRARGFADADDIASVIHHRLANATTRPPAPAAPAACRVSSPG